MDRAALAAHGGEYGSGIPDAGAIVRLGTVEEGTFRKHMVTENGRVRHTVYFSAIDEEWTGVRARLEGMGDATERS